MLTRSLWIVRCCVVALLIFGSGCSSDKSKSAATSPENQAASSPATAGESGADPLPLPEFRTGLCRIYGGDEQSIVLIDGQPARDDEGNYLSPPCEVRVERGNRTVTLTKKGFQDFSKVVNVSETSDVDFPELQTAAEFSVTTATAPLFDLEPGVPYRFETVNSPGAELDPWLSPDGLTLWFAGNRSDGKAIYTATRPSVWHEFTEPESLLLSRGPTLPASPSITGDNLTVYFAAPADGRIWRLSRENAFDRFANKEVALKAADASVSWSSSFVTPDDLRMYWTEVSGNNVRGFAAVRKSPADKFSSPIEYPLPGLIPVLSSDGLRQYSFDGTSLRRARRSALSEPFNQPREIHKLSLTDYTVQQNRRQYFVSEDEQWLIYSQGDETNADLWIVRLSRDPGWAVTPTGKPIAPRPPVVAVLPDPKPNDTPANVKEVDPRTIPLPIAAYRETWLQQVAQREYNEATALTKQALNDPELEQSRNLLQEDLVILQSIGQFWTLAEFTFKNLDPGRSMTLGSARAVFQKYENGLVSMTLGGKSIERPLRSLPATTVSTIVEGSIAKADALAHGQLAHFLLFDKEGRAQIAYARVKDYPEQHEELLRHATEADLHLAERELDRDNLLAGFRLLQHILQEYPGTPAFERAKALELKLYEDMDWQIVGKRRWDTSDGGEFRADNERSEGSFLRSPRAYKNFVLQFEWMTFGNLGQGGVFFHYSGEGRVYNRAFKIHLANDYRAAPDAYSSGSLFGMIAPSENNVKPAGEWNQCRIVVQEGNLNVFMNGKKVLETLAVSDEIPDEGVILFDGITGGIAYRHILLMEAP